MYRRASNVTWLFVLTKSGISKVYNRVSRLVAMQLRKKLLLWPTQLMIVFTASSRVISYLSRFWIASLDIFFQNLWCHFFKTSTSDINADLIKELRKSTFRPSRPRLYDITNKENVVNSLLLKVIMVCYTFSVWENHTVKNNSFELKLQRAGDQIQLDLDIYN